MRKKRSRMVVALALAAVLTVPAAHAQTPGGAGPRLWQLPASLWSWVESLLPWEVVSAADCDKGSSIDPNGGCMAAAAAPDSDKGGCIDPNGGCVAAASAPPTADH